MPFNGGTGTELDPYLVGTPAQLDDVRNYPDKFFKQTADIDLVSFANWVPIGFVLFNEEYEVISNITFSGGYDGNSYKISNLTIDRPNGSPVGLFGKVIADGVGVAKFKNIFVENADILGCGETGILVGSGSAEIYNCHVQGVVETLDTKCGGLAGSLWYDSIVELCSANCIIVSTYDYTYAVGGLIGDSFAKSVKGCYAIGSITADVVSVEDIGGLVGSSGREGTVLDGIYENCFANVDITAGFSDGGKIGGFVGYTELYITFNHCYSCGEINITFKESYTTTHIGGFLGRSEDDDHTGITNCYYDSTVSGRSDSDRGTPKTTTEMKEAETFSTWPSEDWAIVETNNEGYPYLVDNNPYGGEEPEEIVEEEHMVEQISVTTGGNMKEFVGVSTDAKPTEDVGSGSSFREFDTGKLWVFSNLNINPVTSNGWWEVINYVSMLT